MAEQLSAIRRDTALEARMLEAIIADRNDRPRSKQLQAGPSSIGFCRELLRATLFEPDSVAEPESAWAIAAHVGSVMGEDLERIFGERLNALTQERVTTLFGNLGLQISGATDLQFINENHIDDLKSVDDMGSLLYDLEKNASIVDTLMQIWRDGQLYAKNIETPDGGYELTEVMLSKLAKLHYYVQLSIYVAGAIQAGQLTHEADGRLVFYDRSGNFPELVALVITNEELQMFFDVAQHRIDQVVRAQEAYEGTGGNPAVIAHLRDKAPSFCFSPKVMCQRRMHCWGGSDWTADQELKGADIESALARYKAGRAMGRLADGMKRSAKEELRGITGRTADGTMLTWGANGAINVVETAPRTGGALAESVVTIAERAEIELNKPAEPATNAEERERELKKMLVAELRTILESDYDLPTTGKKAELVARILEHEWPGSGSADDAPVEETVEIAGAWSTPTDQAFGVDVQVVAEEETRGVDFDAMLAAQEAAAAEEKSVATQVMEEDAVFDQMVEMAAAAAEVADDLQNAPSHAAAPAMPSTIMIDDQPFLCSCGSRFFYQLGERTWDCTACGQRYGDALPEEPPTPPQEDVLAAMGKTAYFEQVAVLRRRQELYGMDNLTLQSILDAAGIRAAGRQDAIEKLIDIEFPDPIRQMQHDVEKGLRQRLGQVTSEQVEKRIEGGA